MIPESDQIFTEVELGTLEKAINETTVIKDQVILGEGEGGRFGLRFLSCTFTQGHGIECACFVSMPPADLLCVSVFSNAHLDTRLLCGG